MTKQFDLQAFKEFVASKLANKAYDGFDPSHCALAQFGFPRIVSRDCPDLGIPCPVYEAAVFYRPHTFGALLDRLNNLTAAPSLAAEGGDPSPVSTLMSSEMSND
jgi:hypothetical protein